MKARKWLRGLLSGFLCASVISAFGGSTAVTIHAEEDDDSDGIVANKTASVNEEDGSYTIDLEAYVKGEVVTVQKSVDVILIVDVSNSMAWRAGTNSGDGLNYNQTKLYSAMQAAKTLSNIILKDDEGNETGNSLSFVTFAGFDEQNHNSGSYFDSVQTVFSNYTNANRANSKFDDVYFIQRGNNYYLTFDGSTNIQNNAHNNMGGTNYDYGFWQAEDVVDEVQTAYADEYTSDDRETFVIFMTDGAPSLYDGRAADNAGDGRNTIPGTSDTYDNFPHTGNASADNWYRYITTTINGYADDVYEKVDGNMFAIGFDLEHGGFNNWTFTGNNDLPKFLENMMYTDNTSGTAGGERKIPVETATDEAGLKEIFKRLAEEIASAAIDLSEEAVMKDIVANSFTLPEGADANDISVSVVKWDQANQKWSDTDVYDKAGWKTATGEEIEVTVDGDTVDVTGFNYSDHFLADTKETGKNADAAKIVVSFKIFAKPESITGSSVVTNGAESGIYDQDGNAVTTFDIPNVKFENETYIIDYAKPAVLDYSKILTTVTRIDDPTDNILKGQRVEPAGASSSDSFDFSKTFETDYAHVTYENVYNGDTQQTTKFLVTYEPKTTNWNGYDKLFVMGKPNNGDSSIEGGNVWGLMTVLPANNVYYEDTFITTEGTNGENSDTVGITYTGAWSEDGSSTNQIEHANGTVMGWEETLADDTTYSDGSAHKASGSGSASFSFTGTGVDIYSRTNDKTGTIVVSVSGTPEGSDTKVVKNYIISNKAASGDYYQIPTFTIDNLDYGTYNVKITVTKAAASAGRLEYYLDGIRVYNPIKNKEDEDLVQEAYVNELGAVFTEVKGLLEEDKVAFIDEDADGNPVEADYTDNAFAPEHEVYVKAGSYVVIGVDDTSKNYYIGLKAPEGSTSVEMTEGSARTTQTIGHSTDLYYKVIPDSDGTITIKNTGSTLLALTKIRATDSANRGVSPDAVTYSNVDADRAASALAKFASMNYADYEDDVLTPEEAEITEQPEAEEVVEAPEEEPEEEIIELGEDDITISITEPEPAEEETSAADSSSVALLKQWYQNLFSAIARLFH